MTDSGARVIERMRVAYDYIAPPYSGMHGPMPQDLGTMAARLLQLSVPSPSWFSDVDLGAIRHGSKPKSHTSEVGQTSGYHSRKPL